MIWCLYSAALLFSLWWLPLVLWFPALVVFGVLSIFVPDPPF